MSNKRGSDLPEPAWWARCRAMKAAGYTNREVAAALNKSDSSVDGVLNREKRLAHRRERYARDKSKLPPRDRSDRDHMRTKARAEARSRWRNEQYKRPLDTYYRELECL